MNVDVALDALGKFFNDLIGALVPGAVLASGLLILHAGPGNIQELSKVIEGTAAGLMLAGLLFALGHAILAVHEHTLKSLLTRIRLIRGFNTGEAEKRGSYLWFAQLVETTKRKDEPSTETLAWSYNDLRNVALSVSSEAASLGRRFMFISLLCNGVGTSLVIMGFDLFACHIFAANLLYPYQEAALWWVQMALLFFVAILLFRRADLFYERAMATPFSIAVAELRFKQHGHVGKPAD